MDDNRGISGHSREIIKIFLPRKYMILTLFVIVLLILFSGGFGLVNFLKNKSLAEKNVCGDGTFYDSCSLIKPYFCSDGYLIERSFNCGCPEGFAKENEACIPQYASNFKEINLEYVLRGERDSVNFPVYGGFADYLAGIPKSIPYSEGQSFSRADFKIKAVSEDEQRKMLLPLIVTIQNITSDKEDQVRIAISIVQNIPFGNSNETQVFGAYKLNYSRYPYEVLYDMQGVCGEKTDLLIFLLKEMGYGTAFFYYPDENHEAFGIKCPAKRSLEGSGYCFVETTGPSIITDNKINYVDTGKLSSVPEIYPISEGISIKDDLYEYGDARKLIRVRDFAEENGWLGPLKKRTLENLNEKYGLVDEYYGG